MEYTITQVQKKIGEFHRANTGEGCLTFQFFTHFGPTIFRWYINPDKYIPIKDFKTIQEFMEYDPSADPNI